MKKLLKPDEKIKNAIEEFKNLKSRNIHPSGTFDNACRWYPDEEEEQSCCESIRRPSGAYPYSLLVHCRSLKHVCKKHNVDYADVRKFMRKNQQKEGNS